MRSFLGLLVVPLALGACGDDGETASGGWARLPDLPFATSLPITAWTGEEVLVVGGDTRPCPPNAGCANPSRIITTGAAYDVDDERWRPIADAPQPLAGYDRSTFVDGTLVVQTDEGRTWLAYDVAEDAWRRLPAPPEPTLDAGSLTADGSGFVALTESRGVVRHDLGRAWVPYPDPPLRPVTAVAIGNGIAVSSADGAITVWDGQEWSPPQPVPQANPFRHWTGEALVEIDPQEYDDVPAGGRYEPDSGEWTALEVPGAAGDHAWSVNAASGALVAAWGHLYDDRDGSFTALPDPGLDDYRDSIGSVIIDGGVVVVGGAGGRDDYGPVDEAWVWTP